MAGEKILVIDDEETICILLEQILRAAGYSVETASSGEEAIEKAKATTYHLMFVDSVMPGMDANQVCKVVRAISPRTSLIFMTGKFVGTVAQREAEFQAAGGKVYALYKPLSREEILEAARNALAT